MRLAHYIGLLHRAQIELANDANEAVVFHLGGTLASLCDRHAEPLVPFAQRYGEEAPDEPERLHSELFRGTRTGPVGLLRHLHDLYLMAAECDIAWTLVGQAAQVRERDEELLQVVPAASRRPPRRCAGCARA